MAAAGAQLTWKGSTRPVGEPRIVDAAEAAALARAPFALVVGRMPAAIVLRRNQA